MAEGPRGGAGGAAGPRGEGGAATWLGHATVLVEVRGTTFLTDPVLRGRIAHLRRHVPDPEHPRAVDAVLLSHAHHDHLDLPSLKRLPRDTLVLAAPGAARVARSAGLTDVRTLAAGEWLEVGGVRVAAVPAVHDGRRHPLAPQADAVGFVLDERIYFAGDTEPFDAMATLAPLDLALLPIWGWGHTLGPGHMDPGEAAEAAALLRPRAVVPIHWGTFLPVGMRRRRPELLTDPGPEFARRLAEHAPATRAVLLQPGLRFDIP